MKVISIVVNNPLFIELQYLTLKKFLLTPYEFIIFNDAKLFPDYTNGNDVSIKDEIKITCNSLNIPCIDIPNDFHFQITSGSERHSYGMNIITEYMKRYPDEYLILDSDMFLIDYLDINIYRKYNTAIVLQQRNERRINYIWPGLCYFNNNNDYEEIFYMGNCDHFILPHSSTFSLFGNYLTYKENSEKIVIYSNIWDGYGTEPTKRYFFQDWIRLYE